MHDMESLLMLQQQQQTTANLYIICKWLDVQVFSDKDYKTVGPICCIFDVMVSRGRERTHTLIVKSRARSSRGYCGLAFIVTLRAGVANAQKYQLR